MTISVASPSTLTSQTTSTTGVPAPFLRAPSVGLTGPALSSLALSGLALAGLVTLASSGAFESHDLSATSPASIAAPAGTAVNAGQLVAGITFPAGSAISATQLAAGLFTPLAPIAPPIAAPVVAPEPRVIMVIRHGEKPAKGHSLTARGWNRARELPALFAAPDAAAPTGLPAPKTIFAASATDAGTGQRTRETVSSLSSRLSVPVNTAYGKGQEASLVRRAIAEAESGPVLICWQHGEIPAIARALKVVGPQPPGYWPGNRFDMVWKFTETPAGWTFSVVPERLLPGDVA